MAVATGDHYYDELNFEGERELGKGSFGVVDLVYHKTTKERLARKTISLKNLSEYEKQATQKEVEVLQTANDHSHILRLKGFTKTADHLYIYTEYCSRGDLNELLIKLDKTAIPEKLIVCWLGQIADALKYLHGKKIIHRDIKPANIFLTEEGNIKIGDLGIARVMERTGPLPKTIIGTPVYTSPEMLNGRGYNEKTDIWSLGCVIYELATTKQAITLSSLTGIGWTLSEPPSTIPGTYSQEFCRVTLAMLDEDPGSRLSAQDIINSEPVKSYFREPYSPQLEFTSLKSTGHI